MAALDLVPNEIQDLYEVREWRNALAILAAAHPDEWREIIEMLSNFRLLRSDIMTRVGRMRVINHYRCPDCGHEWQDEWSAMSDDDCPECGLRAIEPYESDDTDED